MMQSAIIDSAAKRQDAPSPSDARPGENPHHVGSALDLLHDSMGDRQKDVYLVLRDIPYDKKTSYRLVLRDADTGIEQQSVSVIIDRAIADDF